VVIYRGEFPGVTPSPGATSPSDAAAARNICIYVGVAGQGEINYYSDVSIEGLRATPDGPVLTPARQT
jgi:hypothetical protein